jgi:hypothetical protein
MSWSIRVKLKRSTSRSDNHHDFRIRKCPGPLMHHVGLFPPAWFARLVIAMPDRSKMDVQGLVSAEAQAWEHQRLRRRSAEHGHAKSLIE